MIHRPNRFHLLLTDAEDEHFRVTSARRGLTRAEAARQALRVAGLLPEKLELAPADDPRRSA
jgi:hypothetical protein